MPSENGKFTPFLIVQCSAIMVLVGLLIFWPGAWNSARWTGFLIAFPAAILFVLARYQLGNSFSVTPQARELVTHGVYAKIRNPVYVFSGLVILGLLVGLQNPSAFLLLVIVIPVQIVRARKEARVLEDKFGDAYREYREGTWF
jgi:protein-S-isoprenylcysteine O-methyltransferase Ste14